MGLRAGEHGFDKVNWRVDEGASGGGQSVRLTHSSPDGEEVRCEDALSCRGVAGEAQALSTRGWQEARRANLHQPLPPAVGEPGRCLPADARC